MDELVSRQQIAGLTESFCRGIDRADVTSLQSLFHEDSTVINGSFNGNGHEFATKICRVVKAVFNRTHHSITSQRFRIDGDAATGETHIVSVATITGEDGGPAEILARGVYHDKFERRDGVWKFSERIFSSDWAVHRSASEMSHSVVGQDMAPDHDPPEDHIYQLWQ